jgi:hypothetical protein
LDRNEGQTLGSSASQWYYAKDGERHGPVTEAELQSAYISNLIDDSTKIWSQGYPAWIPLRNSNVRFIKEAPPPLSGAELNNVWVWLLVAAPIITSVAEVMFQRNVGSSGGASFPWLLALGLNSTFSALDEKAVKAGGYRPTSMWLGVLLVPVYAFMRGARTGRGQLYGWLWILSFLISIIIAAAAAVS